jgi:hypothetical protein
MDFKNLEGAPPDFEFTSEQKQIRKLFYIAFANTCCLQKLYSDILERFKKYIEEHVLTQNDDKDILYYFFESVKYENSMEEQVRSSISIEVKKQPLLAPFNIAPEYKFANQVVSKVNSIGFQHLYELSTIKDSSESNTNTSDSDIGSGDASSRKRLKTCQRAIEVDCGPLLEVHTNRTKNTGMIPNVDVLIFMDKSVCKKLSTYLGLIYIEDILEEAEENQFNDIVSRLNNKNAKLFRLLQSYINKYLIAGNNNVCLTHHFVLWQNINANVRAVISNELDYSIYMKVSQTANFVISLDKHPSFLSYVEAVSMIIDKFLHCKCHVIAKYKCDKNLYCKVKLSLLSVIPLYILQYFRQCKILECECEL